MKKLFVYAYKDGRLFKYSQQCSTLAQPYKTATAAAYFIQNVCVRMKYNFVSLQLSVYIHIKEHTFIYSTHLELWIRLYCTYS